VHDDREQRAELDDDLEGARRLAAQAELVADEDEVAGRRDRQVLGQALDEAEDERVEWAQAVVRVSARAATRAAAPAGPRSAR